MRKSGVERNAIKIPSNVESVNDFHRLAIATPKSRLIGNPTTMVRATSRPVRSRRGWMSSRTDRPVASESPHSPRVKSTSQSPYRTRIGLSSPRSAMNASTWIWGARGPRLARATSCPDFRLDARKTVSERSEQRDQRPAELAGDRSGEPASMCASVRHPGPYSLSQALRRYTR